MLWNQNLKCANICYCSFIFHNSYKEESLQESGQVSKKEERKKGEKESNGTNKMSRLMFHVALYLSYQIRGTLPETSNMMGCHYLPQTAMKFVI